MSTQQVMPRWLILREIALRLIAAAIVFVCVYGLIVNLSTSAPSRVPAAYGAFSVPPAAQIILLLACSVSGLLLASLFRSHKLLESEQYLVLIILALILASWVGAANYTIYLFNPDSFIVDKELLNQLTSTQEKEWQTKLEDAQENVEGCEVLLRALKAEPEETLVATKSSADHYGVRLRETPITIDFTLGLFFGEDEHLPTAVYWVHANADGRRVTVSRDEGIVHGTPWGFSIGRHLYFDRRVSTTELIQLFERHEEWESTNWISPLKKPITRRAVPLTLFLYQSLMDTVGANPRYFSPKSSSSRAIAFLYAVLKLVFFGMVITTVAKHHGRQSPEKAESGS